MRGFVAPTDHGWYQFLLGRAELNEVNFWRPGGGNFVALTPGEPFFFKLKAPYNAIGGFGLFAQFARLPVWRAWDVFGQANGTSDEYDLLARLHRLGSRQDLPRPKQGDRVHRGQRDRVLPAGRMGAHARRLVPDDRVRSPLRPGPRRRAAGLA